MNFFSGVLLFTIIFSVPSIVRAQDEIENQVAEYIAMDACMNENNLTRPTDGSTPTEADQETIKNCMESKGYAHPPKPTVSSL